MGDGDGLADGRAGAPGKTFIGWCPTCSGGGWRLVGSGREKMTRAKPSPCCRASSCPRCFSSYSPPFLPRQEFGQAAAIGTSAHICPILGTALAVRTCTAWGKSARPHIAVHGSRMALSILIRSWLFMKCSCSCSRALPHLLPCSLLLSEQPPVPRCSAQDPVILADGYSYERFAAGRSLGEAGPKPRAQLWEGH